jgi:hypothetical protein
MRFPFDGDYPITREFGVKDEAYANYPNSRHSGADFGLPSNTPLYASVDGIATIHDRSKELKTGRGKEVSIYANGTYVNTCHMNRIDVKQGQRVIEGQLIGLSGSTGFSTGPHLHLEVITGQEYVDPIKYIKEHTMPSLNAAEIDEFISQTYQKIAGRPPASKEFDFHRNNFAVYGPVWALRMIEGFKGDDVAWKKYERNLQDAGKLLSENPDAKTLAKIKEILEKGV